MKLITNLTLHYSQVIDPGMMRGSWSAMHVRRRSAVFANSYTGCFCAFELLKI